MFLYSYPFLVYKKIFNRPAKEYFVSIAKFAIEWMLIFAFIGAITSVYDRIITIDNSVINFIVRGVTLFVSANIVLFIIYGKSKETKYYVSLVKGKLLHKA